MTGINPLSFREEENPNITDKGPFPYAVQSAAPMPDNGQPVAGADRMKQLEQMLHEAQGRAEIIEKEAYDKAYLAGEKAGMALGQKRAEQLLESVQESLNDTEKSIADIKLAFAEAAMDVAHYIAENIIGETLERDTSKIWQIAEQAVMQLPDTSDLRIAVSPDDFAAFKRLLDESELIALLTSDDNMTPKTCRVISSQQDILIDPVAATATFIEQLRPALLVESTSSQETESGSDT